MWKAITLPVTLFLAIPNPTVSKEEGLQCVTNLGRNQKTHISVNFKRSEGGEWDTQFSAERNGSLSSDVVDLDLTHDVSECSDHRIIRIRGEIKVPDHTKKPRLLFSKICSPNAAITNGGRSLQKYKQEGQATALTDRPLMNEEMFRVRLDRRSSKYPFGIGVTSHSPGGINIPDHINNIKSGTWLFYNTHLYSNGSISYPNFIKSDMKTAKAGDVFGVMRSKYGSLHLFVNGVDQGPAAPIPENVYGAYELYDGGLEGTIID